MMVRMIVSEFMHNFDLEALKHTVDAAEVLCIPQVNDINTMTELMAEAQVANSLKNESRLSGALQAMHVDRVWQVVFATLLKASHDVMSQSIVCGVAFLSKL